MRPAFAFLVLICLVGATAYAEENSSSLALKRLDDQQAVLTVADLDALARVKVTAKQHGVSHEFEGALLRDVLARVGAPSGSAIRGAELADIVIVEARDGYKVVLDLAGTDPTMRADRVILADRIDGAALEAAKGPFELIIEGDLRAARASTRFPRSALNVCDEAPRLMEEALIRPRPGARAIPLLRGKA